MKKQALAEIMSRGFETKYGEIVIPREDITTEFLALANGYKANGGDVYVTQTYDLKGVAFEDRMETYRFMAWAMGYTEQ